MKWPRYARRVVWLAAAALAVWTVGDTYNRMLGLDQSAMQQSARGSMALVELVGLFVVAFALDRILASWDR